MSTYQLLLGDNLQTLKSLPAESVHCIVTSPPYWGLRDYGLPPTAWPKVKFSPMPGLNKMTIPAQECCLGLEADPWAFVAHMVLILREARRVLRSDGVLWLNLGDSYATGAGAVGEAPGGGEQGARWAGPAGAQGKTGLMADRRIVAARHDVNRHRDANRRPATSGRGEQQEQDRSRGAGIGPMTQPNRMPQPGLKPKDLMGMPWRVFFALQADGWFGRQDVIWQKPNPMPESVTDRCTKAHEYVFLLAKSRRYYFDADDIKEPVSGTARPRGAAGEMFNSNLDDHHSNPGCRPDRNNGVGWGYADGEERKPRTKSGNKSRKPGSARGCPEGTGSNVNGSVPWEGECRNKRSVWNVPTAPFKGAHFATYPPALIVPCILAGSPRGGVVLDLYGGSGTTAGVANALGRDAVLCELSPEYAAFVPRRVAEIKRDFEHLNQIQLPIAM
jgi:DNA modification methylase